MENIWDHTNLIKVLKNGGVAVIPTDTIYGIVGRAEDREGVERIYKLRKRNPEKPCIILISDEKELSKFNISLTEAQKEKIKELGDKPTSFILDCPLEKFAYLHRGTNSLAFRIPQNKNLQNLLIEVGPLIAPSANTEGTPPSKNINEAKNYFGEAVDFYLNGGEIKAVPSRVVRLLTDGIEEILRE